MADEATDRGAFLIQQHCGDVNAAPVAARIRATMAATTERRLGRVSMEPDRAFAHRTVRARSWPGDAAWATRAMRHAHAAWVDPTAGAGACLAWAT